MTVKDAVRWFQEHLGPINRFPSWANELISGLLCVGVAWLVLAAAGESSGSDLSAFTFPLSLAISEFYEHLLDPWGYSPQDVVERVRGVALAMAAWGVINWPTS